MSFFLSLLNAMPGAITQGMLWGIMAIGVYITYRILDVADLTVDGSLATGGAVCVMLMRAGWNPWAALLCAFLAGVLAGLCTGLLHTRCGIPAILAGILTQLALYSVNLRIMTGKANQPIGVDKYDLLVSQRYVRDLALNNPIPLVILFLAVLGSAVCFAMWNTVISRLGVVRANNYIYLQPFITIVASHFLLGEPISWTAIVGALLIVGGVIISGRRAGEKP